MSADTQERLGFADRICDAGGQARRWSSPGVIHSRKGSKTHAKPQDIVAETPAGVPGLARFQYETELQFLQINRRPMGELGCFSQSARITPRGSSVDVVTGPNLALHSIHPMLPDEPDRADGSETQSWEGADSDPRPFSAAYTLRVEDLVGIQSI